MANPTDSIDIALEDIATEPLPTHTRDHSAQPDPDDVVVDYAEDDRGGTPPASQKSDEHREIPPEEGIEQLRARLQQSDAARRQAEDRATQAEQARADAVGGAQDANVQFLETALGGLKQTIGVLEANLAEAYSVQDFGQVAKIQTEIARAAQRESVIESGLEQLKTAPREQPQPAPRPAAEDPVEAVASKLTPNAAAWIRAHPDYITDPGKNQRLMSAHYAAMADGLAPDSHEYIRYVEEHVQPRSQPQYERRDSMPETRRSAPPAAPVSRGASNGGSPARITLTREQRETAHENFPDEMQADPSGRKAEQAYARNMLILKREGRLN